MDEAPPELSRSALARRITGFVGVAGGLLMFSGDMLFYGHWGAGSNFHEGMIAAVRQASDQRLFAGGLVGPVAACLFIVGFWHIFLNVEPKAPTSARVVFLSLTALMVCGSSVHALWTPYGLALKHCYGQGAPCPDLVAAIRSYWNAAYDLSAVPGYVGFLLLIVLVLLGRTRYPRWTAMANPAVLLLFEPLAEKGPAPWGAVLTGGFTNLSFVTFFVVSLAATWNEKR
jgi:Family of unknown function (DUF6796)